MTLLAGARGTESGPGGLNISTDNGTSWGAVNAGLTNTNVHAVAISPASGGSGVNLFAGTLGGVFRSANNGTSWSAINTGLTNTYVQCFAIYGTNVFAGTLDGVFLSTNNGTNWVNTGLKNSLVSSLAISDRYLFAGIDSGRVWRRPLLQMVTAVEDKGGTIPTQLSLDQNYPNPFNPATTVSFSLPLKSFVSLKVFDALGRNVATLASEEMSAGIHTMRWNASNVPSGTYFCRLQAGAFTETRKAVLLK
jgi:hypothetical protein